MKKKIVYGRWGTSEPYKYTDWETDYGFNIWKTNWKCYIHIVPWRFQPPDAVILLRLGNGYTDEWGRKTQLTEEEKRTVDWLFDFCDKAASELFDKSKKFLNYDGECYCLKRVNKCIMNKTNSLFEQILKRHSTLYKKGI